MGSLSSPNTKRRYCNFNDIYHDSYVFFFTAVASYIVGLVGNSNSPVSGMTITAVLFTGGLLYIFGFSGAEGMVATLGSLPLFVALPVPPEMYVMI